MKKRKTVEQSAVFFVITLTFLQKERNIFRSVLVIVLTSWT